MSDFLPIAEVGSFPDPGKQTFEAGDRMIVLVRIGAEFYCLDDVCSHDGGPLGEGPLAPGDRTLACPRHGAKFSLVDGRALCMPATEPTSVHETKVENGMVWVRLNEG
jgi:3-phenylpropionate/trans-cinnamate dioxygenase ferredoxin subunit